MRANTIPNLKHSTHIGYFDILVVLLNLLANNAANFRQV